MSPLRPALIVLVLALVPSGFASGPTASGIALEADCATVFALCSGRALADPAFIPDCDDPDYCRFSTNVSVALTGRPGFRTKLSVALVQDVGAFSFAVLDVNELGGDRTLPLQPARAPMWISAGTCEEVHYRVRVTVESMTPRRLIDQANVTSDPFTICRN